MTRETNGTRSPRFNLKALEEQVAQQAAMAEQAEQAAQQAREAKTKAEQELLDAMVEAEADAKAQAQTIEDEAEALYASLKGRVTRRPDRPMKLPQIGTKIMERSYQRSKIVGGGTQLSSGAKQATVTFPPKTFKVIELAAADNEVSLSEMVRQLVDRGLRSQD